MSDALLAVALAAAVPIWQARLRKDGGPTDETWERCRAFAEKLVGPGGEDLRFREKRTREMFNDLAYTLAVMSFAPGGVKFLGKHWETRRGLSVTLTIPGDPMALSPNRRLHRHARAKLVRTWKGQAAGVWREAGCPRLLPPVEISFTVRRGRPVDYDNAMAALKPVVDAITERGSPLGGGMIPDDGPQFVRRIEVAQETGAEWKGREEVVMTVREIDG